MSSLGYEGLVYAYLILLAASAGVLHHSGIKIPYFAFFGHDGGHQVKEAPLGMLVAMGIAGLLCILIGILPSFFYTILPYQLDYNPYDAGHVLAQMQLLIFSILAFAFLMTFKIYPPELRSTVLNSDWFYRRLFPAFGWPLLSAALSGWGSFLRQVRGIVNSVWDMIDKIMHSSWAGPTVSGRAVLIQAGLLSSILLIAYVAVG